MDNIRKSGRDNAAKRFGKGNYGASKGFEMCLKIWKFLRGRGKYIPEVGLYPQVAADMTSFDAV